jgi:alpha-galactosidase
MRLNSNQKIYCLRSAFASILIVVLLPFYQRTWGESIPIKAPPNQPASLTQEKSRLTLAYNDRILLELELVTPSDDLDFNQVIHKEKDCLNQVFKWTSRTKDLHFKGTLYASEESFPCEAEKKHGSLNLVRHSYGLSRSLLNRAVYDRKFDWSLSADFPCQIKINPADPAPDRNQYTIELTGREITLRFQPYYYQKHRGLKYYKPWTYQVWHEPVVGWCSWFAYFTEITEDNIKHAADIMAETLAPYGFEYLQIDDGYQQESAGTPNTWLKPNQKFPSGLGSLSQYITTAGLKPGIWTYTSFHEKEYAHSHKQYFVRNENNEPAYGNWVGYILDGSNPDTIEDIIRPIYRGLKDMGWKYFKVDALRHLRYEGYNSFPDYFKEKNLDRVEIYRNFVSAIRKEIGKECFMLGCWGIRPELIGIIDGCRIGTDGFGYGGLAQYNSFNNVVWRNDPDHIELTPEEAFRSSMVTSLTGSLFMLTDKPEIYRTPLAEAAKRSAPVLFTLPGQIYDIDPTRSALIDRVDSEISGSGPRIFDADQAPVCNLFLLELNTNYENWVVLGRTNSKNNTITFEDLGLPPDKEYHVFEFWTKEFLGSFTSFFSPPDIDPEYNCQLLCIRESKNHPQVLASNRHISCGALEMNAVEWKDNTLSGKSSLISGDTYILYIFEPAEFTLKQAVCTEAKIINDQKTGLIRVIEFLSESSLAVDWEIKF